MQGITDHTEGILRQGGSGSPWRGSGRALCGAVAMLCGLLVVPPAADATSVSYTRSDFESPGLNPHDVTFNISGSGAENNAIEVTAVDSSTQGNPSPSYTSAIRITERGSNAGLSVTDPIGLCATSGGVNAEAVECATYLAPSSGNDVRIAADLGGGTDSYAGPGNRFSWATEFENVAGGDHKDVISGGAWPAWMFGEGGDDAITRSSVSNNVLYGGPGWDVINAKGNGADAVIDCGGSGASTNDGRARVDPIDPAASCSGGTGDAPTASIDDGPGDGPGAFTNQTTAEFEFSSEPGTTFECRRYESGEAAPAWDECGSPKGYSNLTGDPVTEYRFEVRAKDIAGFTSAVDAYTWTVDTVPPQTDFDPLGAVVTTNDPTPKLPSFGSPDDDVDHFECRNATIDGPWVSCVPQGQWPGVPLTDGTRRVEVRAVDKAGNPDPLPDHQDYLIDTTPPDVSFDNGQSPSGAEVVSAHYTETGSGFKSAQILARLRNSGGVWRALPTTERSGALSARLDSLSPGVYEFEARVTDKATNVGVTSRAENGTDLVLEITYLSTRTSLGFPGSARDSARLSYGHSGQVIGTLRSAAGAPLAGQVVRLVESFYAGSAQESRTRTFRTDPRGQISANLPPGPSREVELSYPGAGTYRPSRSDELEVEVEGAVTLKAKRRVRAGHKLKFKGLVPHEGALLPAGGKLVEVQVRVEGRWRAVTGSSRTKPNGGYKLQYRFGKFYARPTRFMFRTKVIPEQGWPFVAPVYSNQRKVKVLPVG